MSYKPGKSIAKGIAGALIGGGSAVGALTASGKGVDDPQEALIVAVTTIIGFAVRAFANWLKNR
jgi:hypothetical protein